MDTNFDIGIEEIYAAVSANSQENSISCEGVYLLYSRCNCPVLYDTEQQRVVSLLIGHSDRVINQHFVDTSSCQSDDLHIISTAHDKTAIIWQFQRSSAKSEIVYQFTAPNESSFTSSCSFRDHDGNFITITTSIDCSICLWVNADISYIIETTYCCFESKLFSLDVGESDYKFLFLAGSDNKVRLFQVNKKSLHFLFQLLGHSDWIKCIDAVPLRDRKLEFLLASSSQDSYVRVWHMKLVDCDLDLSQQIRTTVSKLENGKFRLAATLETVLSGHEGIVYGLCWFKQLEQPALQMITCSADKTLILWKSSIAPPNEEKGESQKQLNKYDQCPATVGVWQQVERFGETGETNLPFLGVCLSRDETTIYALSLRGSVHSWSRNSLSSEVGCWQAKPGIFGHFGPITDLSWEKSGAYLLSISLDKTCRLHAISSGDQKWYELARPQVHGHEINCLVSIDPIRFVSGAEEKTARVFKATQFFVKNFKFLSSARLGLDNIDHISCLPPHAQLPALGLSNKGADCPYGDLESADNQESGANSNWYAVSKLVEHLATIDHLESPPIEEILLQSTLWVETHKLFGHSNELYALAVDSTGRYIASASKANRSDLANVLIWDCTRFRKNSTVEHHSLTVTRLRFSPDDRYLLSVSRDRTWCLSERTENPKPSYTKLIGTSKSNAIHERIIWDCCWTCDSRYFVTVSRDKKAILWSADHMRDQACISTSGASQNLPDLSPACTQLFDCSIQAVDSPSTPVETYDHAKTGYLFAFGLENGALELHLASIDSCSQASWQCIKAFSNYHHLSIRRLAFRPSLDLALHPSEKRTSTTTEVKTIRDSLPSQPAEAVSKYLVASGADDCIVKLSQISIRAHRAS